METLKPDMWLRVSIRVVLFANLKSAYKQVARIPTADTLAV